MYQLPLLYRETDDTASLDVVGRVPPFALLCLLACAPVDAVLPFVPFSACWMGRFVESVQTKKSKANCRQAQIV